jgi:hypothetical protein
MRKFTSDRRVRMKNPLESLHMTIGMGVILTVILVVVVQAMN